MSKPPEDTGVLGRAISCTYGIGAALRSLVHRGEPDPLVPPEYVESSFERNPPAVGSHAERIAQGEHTIPHGRAIRLAYEHQREDGDFYVIRRAYYDGREVGEVDVTEMDVVQPEGVVIPEPTLHSGYPEEPPEEFASSHFHLDQGGELTDGFMQCVGWDVAPEEYPVNPVQIE
jgi:hypothetical protein